MEPLSNKFNEVDRNDLEWLKKQPIDVKMEIMQNHLSICQVIANEIMAEEVHDYAGERYSRNKPHGGRYNRWSTNPGSIRVGDTKVRVDVPRIRDMQQGSCVPLKSYERMHKIDAPTEQLVKAVLMGLSMRDYEGVIDYLGEGFGLKKSEVSRRFVDKTRDKLKQFMERDLSRDQFLAIFIDGKSFGGDQIIIVLGITEDGRKIPLDFIQAHSEKAEPVMDMLRNIQSRGVDLTKLLYVVDGSKGFRKAIKQIVGNHAAIQRCTWHKLKNIQSYLPEEEHSKVKSDYHGALAQEDYEDAKADLLALESRLREHNMAAANSLLEGLDEILTLHRLQVHEKLRRTLRSTNCIENLNSQLQKYTSKVKYWKNSEQRYRWIASGLLEVEKKMRRIPNFRMLPLLRKALLLHYENGTSSPISTKVGT